MSKKKVIIETGIRNKRDSKQVWFKIDNQTFFLEDCDCDNDKENLEVAEFYQRMLHAAFDKLNN